MVNDNYAGRLYVLLSDLKNQPSGYGKNGSVLRNVFEIGTSVDGDFDSIDNALLISKVSDLVLMVRKVKEDMINFIDEDPETIKPLRSLEAKLIKLADLDSQFNSNFLTDEIMTTLKLCSKFFKKFQNEKSISDEILQNLKNELEEILDEIINSDLPEEVQKFFQKNLNTIKNAIDNYRISGIDGFREAVEKCVGASILNPEKIAEHRENPKVKKAMDFISKGISVIKGVENVAELIDSINKLFLP